MSDRERVSPVKRLFGGAIGFYGLVFSLIFIAMSVSIAGRSLLGIPFILGGVILFGVSVYSVVQAIRGRPNELESRPTRGLGSTPAGAPQHPEATASPARLSCAHCAAPLRDDTEISPSGDVKCPFCRSWFNVRG